MLTLVDFFGASMIALVLGIAELYTIGWIYTMKSQNDRVITSSEWYFV